MTETSSRAALPAIASLLALPVAIALTLGFLGQLHPALDSFSHFRAHLAVALLAIAILLGIGRLRLHALVAAVFGGAALATTIGAASLFSFGSAQAALTPRPANQPVYKLLQINLLFDNRQPNEVLSLIGRVRPDVITLDEVSSMWGQKLDLLQAAYPHSVRCRSVAILSRRPFEQTVEPHCAKGERFASARFDFAGHPLDVAAIHLRWPWPYSQSEHLDRLAGSIAALGETALMAGDFNAASWSATMRRVERIGQFRQVEGIGATWQTLALPRAFRSMGLPIDHVLAKGDLDIRSAQTLEAVGSDHWPVLVEFSFGPGQVKPVAPVTVQDTTARHLL
jgi:endonuclease/exonuclease/phosphatase (EEP) superfamily protein YafD